MVQTLTFAEAGMAWSERIVEMDVAVDDSLRRVQGIASVHHCCSRSSRDTSDVRMDRADAAIAARRGSTRRHQKALVGRMH
jgi:hypothetical protein